MSRHRFDLLTIEASSNGREPVPRGALAEQGGDVCGKYPLPVRVASRMARLTPSRRVQLLGLDFGVDLEQKQVEVRACGLMAPVIRGQLQRLRRTLARAPRPLGVRDGGFVYNLYQPPVPSLRFINHLSRVAMHGRVPVRPTTCTLQVTTRCQLACAHCSAERYKSRERQELTTAEFQDMIRQAQELGCYNIVLTGGEPLLRPDLFELIGSVDPNRSHVSMFSNGLLLTDENVARLEAAGLYAVMVSIDDPRPEVHDELRGLRGGFERTAAGVRQALAGGLLVGISTYATPEDVRAGRPEQMVELARELGAHEITIFDTVPTGRLLGLERGQLLSATDKDRLIALERSYNAREGYPHVVTQAFVNGPDGAGCFGGHAQFYMTAFGDITPCDFTPLTFGNVRDGSLLECWERMHSHPAYNQRCDHCRMQDPEFRRLYIDGIPDDALLPWPACEELRWQPHSTGALKRVGGGCGASCASG